VQGRGGERIPPAGFMRGLRELCDERGWLLILDEIYTGLGRTGRWFACEHEDVVPDLLCVGKGMSSGMPISACIGKREVMDAWPISHGEAMHTQTFLGHPPSCAAALASMAVIDREDQVPRAAETGARALRHLRELTRERPAVRDVRGLGLLIALELERSVDAATTCDRALAAGVIALRSGDDGRVIGIHPPLGIDPELLCQALDLLAAGLP
jgi:4-aminobutyrate aminotransferase/(S)-3-amino-2-methylpropionate transaminase